MQLNLFEDNRQGILLHIANELILARDIEQAVSLYEQLLADYPGDKHITALLELALEWRDHAATACCSRGTVMRRIGV